MEQPEQEYDGKSHIFPRRTAAPARRGGSFLRGGVIGLHPIAGLLVGGALGHFLWKQFAAPWCFWVLLLVGFIAGCLNAWRDIRAMLREKDAGHAATKPSRS